MWREFFYINGRLSKFGFSNYNRLAFHDTDSFFISTKRKRTDLEVKEMQILLEENRTLAIEDSFLGYNVSSHFIRVYGSVVDWSSITHKVRH